MKRLLTGSVVLCLLAVSVSAQQSPKPAAVVRPAASHALAMTSAAQAELVSQYCAGCHSERGKAGGLSLAGWDTRRASEQRDITEKMIHKLRAGMMPPSGARRPADTTLASLAGALESRMDVLAAANPDPGWRPFQRLNRAEYEAQ